jgi:hypothetical protein
VLNQGLYATERDGQLNQPDVIHEGFSPFETPFYAKTDHGAETIHLPFGNGVLGVAWKSGVSDPCDFGVVIEEFG